ncbi:hypothetical protein SAMN05216344_106123 [Polaromonas sp. OV174]|uniref:hypothetical protein n=1 Tax=Polaromonas sp. OV174 TaxID=1855300 RepID=UPI0008EDDB57|nr:hypothetical protein [Polaromonas sp. OV174]SFB96662.1 hypothetical protein SAMN05216344_106123 [Polaromonas sp. OV174]
MSTVHETVTAALSAVFPNAWAVELPPIPVWPAAVFDIDSAPEEAWCSGGGYTQHDVNLIVLARTIEELDVLLPMSAGGTLRPALEGLDSYQYEDACGDADYEPDPAVYARFLTVRLRTPRY